jgi:GntR family transcriptional regulator
MLDFNNSKPLYEQLKDIIKAQIDNGIYKPGDKLPGERTLMDIYSISRITVREAIGDLVSEGILFRQHGKGTFVAQRRFIRTLAQLLGVIEELQLEQANIDIVPILARQEIPNNEIFDALQLQPNSLVYTIHRLILSEEQPLLLSYNYFPQTIEHIAKNIDLSEDIIFDKLEEYGYKVSSGIQRIGAKAATKEEAKYLNCRIGAPVLVTKRIVYDKNNIPLVYSYAIYRSDRYEYYVELKR